MATTDRRTHPRCEVNEHQWTRRQLLGASAGLAMGGLGGLLSPQVASALEDREKQVLFIWIDGGMSQLESWDPKPGGTFGGPFRAIPTSVPGVHLSELMPRTATMMDRLAVIRSMCTQDNSHSAGVGRIQRGDPKNRGVTYPYFGSAVSKLMGPTSSQLPPYVWVKPGSGGFKHEDAGFLGPQYGALAFGDGQPPAHMQRPESLSETRDQRRQRMRARINQRYVAGRRPNAAKATDYVFDTADILMRRADLFDASSFSSRDKQRYGEHDLGRHMLVGRKMLEAGVRFVKVNSYGWDTHGDNFNAHASLMPKFDQAFAAVVEDLDERGMLDHVLVIAMSEFGRTPRINGHIGRDHWPEAWSVAMAGCGMQRGVVVGETNAAGTWVEKDQADIGHLFHTWFQALGINAKSVEYDNDGQPLPIAHDDCDVVPGLLA